MESSSKFDTELFSPVLQLSMPARSQRLDQSGMSGSIRHVNKHYSELGHRLKSWGLEEGRKKAHKHGSQSTILSKERNPPHPPHCATTVGGSKLHLDEATASRVQCSVSLLSKHSGIFRLISCLWLLHACWLWWTEAHFCQGPPNPSSVVTCNSKELCWEVTSQQ